MTIGYATMLDKKQYLKVYSLKDLQHFSYLLQLFAGVELSAITAIVGREIVDRAADSRRFRRQPPATIEPKPCPHCGGPLTNSIADELTLTACRKCRWSSII